MEDEHDESFTRRTILRRGAATAGAAAVGTAAASGSAAAREGADEKRGGRAQLDGTADRNRPFTLTLQGTDPRNASCMSGESAMQTYLKYQIDYCDSNDDDSEGTLYVIPDEAELNPEEVYEIRAIRPCRESSLERVAFGPSNASC